MTTNYFMAFDFYDTNINKFWFGIIPADLSGISLHELAASIIKENFPQIDEYSVTIKITAFNNITS